MACLVLMDGASLYSLGFAILTGGSAEALASLIWSDVSEAPWTPPDWLPRHYLTEVL